MLRLITDFDGPIVNVSVRYYTVYHLCLDRVVRPGQFLNRLPYEDFWACKRARVPEWKIGLRSGLDEPQARAFAKMRGLTVHNEHFLHHDLPVPGALEALERLRNLGFDLVVMTMRRTRELNEALERCGLGHFFAPDRRYCLANDHVKIGDTKDKPILMQRALRELPPADRTWMVGDTEADILAAQTGRVPAIGVLSGIRDRQQLETYRPDFILGNLSEAVDFILDSIDAPPLTATS
ncbi:MAG: HAD family hydrolase [Geitlerinemataceae cyanobacterium]